MADMSDDDSVIIYKYNNDDGRLHASSCMSDMSDDDGIM